jgi:hypothetical protein
MQARYEVRALLLAATVFSPLVPASAESVTEAQKAAFDLATEGPQSARSETDAQKAAFDRMTRAPLDHSNTFNYVKTSADNRDYEGAIGALERVLLYNPHLGRAHFELGVLYFKLHSYEQAVLHFEEALADSSLEPALTRRIEGYLPDARKQLSRSRLNALIHFGLGYNSNVAGVSGSNFINAFGLDVPSIRPFPKAGDGAAFAMSELSHVYDFENGRGDAWESQFAAYGATHFEYSPLNVGLMDFTTGPRLAIAPDALPGWSVRPYASVGAASVYASQFSASYGGGVSVGIPICNALVVEPGFEVRRVEANSFGGLPNYNVLSTGVFWRGYASATLKINDMATLVARAYGGRNDADFGGISSSNYGFESSLKIDFAPPTDQIGINWSLTPFVRYVVVDFDQPNPFVNPFVTRHDWQFRAGARLNMPITPNVGVAAAAQYDLHDSTIRNYRANGATVLVGPTIRF